MKHNERVGRQVQVEISGQGPPALGGELRPLRAQHLLPRARWKGQGHPGLFPPQVKERQDALAAVPAVQGEHFPPGVGLDGHGVLVRAAEGGEVPLQAEQLVRSRGDAFQQDLVVAPRVLDHGLDALLGRRHVDLHPVDLRGPDAEGAASFFLGGCAQVDGSSHAGALLNTTVARGGRARVREYRLPWTETGAASTPPRLPQPLPPYSVASLLKISSQTPPRGTPTR